jgi:GxxExxY protein
MEKSRVTEEIIGAAIEVHRELGPGLLESAYGACLAVELSSRGLAFERQKPVPVTYKGLVLDCGFRVDLLVEDCIVVELKAVEAITAVHEAQVLTYLRLARLDVGLLINFNVKLLRHGVRRLVHEFVD